MKEVKYTLTLKIPEYIILEVVLNVIRSTLKLVLMDFDVKFELKEDK